MKKISSVLIATLLTISGFSQLSNNPSYQILNMEEFALAEDELQEPQDTVWWTGGLFSFNFSQVSFSNWAAGGVNSISGVAMANFYANMKKGKSKWDNSLNLAYGLLDQKNLDVVKTDDVINLLSNYGYQAWNEKWYYSAFAEFRSQFAEGLDPDTRSRISDFMSPGYITAGLGIENKPNENLSFFISPVTAKWTIVNDQDLADVGAFGVAPGNPILDGSGVPTGQFEPGTGEKVRSEFGAYFRGRFQDELMENVTFVTNLNLFQNFETPTRIDINWDALLGFKVNKYISCTLGAAAIYDHDVLILKDADDANATPYNGRAVQFKEVFNLGFLYNF
ncbi:MAG: DUF3078 domain-containing protein [Bacteroidota bacterium]